MQDIIWIIFQEATGKLIPGCGTGTDHLDPRKKYRYSGEFGSLTLTGRLLRAPGHPDAGLTEMAELLYFIEEFGSFGSRAGRPVPGTYPQDIHRFIVFREFGSLKALDTD